MRPTCAVRAWAAFQFPGQQLVQTDALGPPGDDALQHVGQDGLRIEFMSFAVLTSDARSPQLPAPPSLPLNMSCGAPSQSGAWNARTVLVSTSTRRRGETASARPSD